MNEQLLLILCGGGAVALVAYFAMAKIIGDGSDEKLRHRLSASAPAGDGAPSATAGGGGGGAVALLRRIGQAAAQPFMPTTREKQSQLRERIAKAGIYTPSSVRLMQGAKVISLGGGLLGGYLAGLRLDMFWMALALGGLFGYLAPTVWLKMRVRENQKALTYGLADALDLMVVCVEAGLTVDAAMQRVGTELAIAHPAMSREFGIAHMETRVGLTRTEALKNMGVRTGCAPLQSLVSMLVQAERFGTSIASALRIHAETLRNNRQVAAEEQASKASVKISFPLVLFIFPSTFIVLCGPVILDLMNSELFR